MVHLLVGVDVDVVKVDGGGGDGVGQHQEEDEDVEPRHLEHPLEEGGGEASGLVLVYCHHLPPVSVAAQNLGQRSTYGSEVIQDSKNFIVRLETF